MMDLTATQHKRLGRIQFWLLSVVVGVGAGLAAIIFRGLIALFHNLLFFGTLSVTYDTSAHTPPSPWGVLIVLIPVLGAVGVVFLVVTFAREAKGTGVPEVMDAIYFGKGIIRPIVAAVKSMASALSIGSGAPVGREGPIIQIGSSFGSTIGQIIPMSTWQRITLIAAGAGGGIAATFNTPIGGILFAIEILMHEISVRTLVPLAISTAVAAYIGRLVFGAHPAFVIPQLNLSPAHATDPWMLLLYTGLGVLLGLVSTVMIRSIYATEDFFEERMPGNYYVRHASGMLLVGISLYLLLVTTGNYYVQGVGYATIQDVLGGANLPLMLLVLLLILKLVTLALALGSGASGGIFSPALYVGATLGGAYGLVLARVFPFLAINPAAFAVAGMAGVVGGATGAALAAIVMIFEMTLDYAVIIPIIVTVAISYGVRKLLCKESIYTMKLARRGHYVPDALQGNLYFLRPAKDMMDPHFKIVPASLTLEKFTSEVLQEHSAISNFLVTEQDDIVGFITRDDASAAATHARASATLREVARTDYLTVTEETTLFQVFARMRARHVFEVLVVPDGAASSVDTVEGILTREQIAESVAEATELFSE